MYDPIDWFCLRCGADVVNLRCKCETSPSPWTPKANARTEASMYHLQTCLQQVIAQRDKAYKALEPFAEVADEYDDREDDNFEVWVDAGPIRVIRQSFKLKLYRAARAALPKNK